MFTGIIEEMGQVREAKQARLSITAKLTLTDMRIGDSIAVNGACLTITSLHDEAFTVDLTPETLECTNLGALVMGNPVNLERPLPVNGRLGGHMAQGHVDATGTVLEVQSESDSLLMRFEAPPSVTRYLVHKGYIAIDGVSLTIAKQNPSSFTVSVIPFTQRHTNLGAKKLGDLVNLEVDILAKYTELFLKRTHY